MFLYLFKVDIILIILRILYFIFFNFYIKKKVIFLSFIDLIRSTFFKIKLFLYFGWLFFEVELSFVFFDFLFVGVILVFFF